MTHSGKSATRLLVIAALSIAGLGFSIYLTQHFYELRSGMGSFKSFCNVNQALNCDAVTASTYSELIGGLPLSSFAAGWYLGTLILALLALSDAWRRNCLRALGWTTTFGLLMSLGYLGVMSGILKIYCLFCLAIDGVNLLNFILVLSLKPEWKGPWNKQGNPIAGILAGSVFVLVVLLKGLDPSAASPASIEDLVQPVLSSAQLSVNVPETAPSLGAHDAPITVVEFSDFQCPYCRLNALTMKTLLNRYPGKIRLVFRNFPLDNSCNRKMDHPLHHFSCEAARITLCANQQGKFEPIYENFFENQSTFAPGKLNELAKESGLDMEKLSACVSSTETANTLSRDIEEAIQLGVESTPTFFVNGHRLEGGLPIPGWDKLIPQLPQMSGGK